MAFMFNKLPVYLPSTRCVVCPIDCTDEEVAVAAPLPNVADVCSVVDWKHFRQFPIAGKLKQTIANRCSLIAI